MAALITVEELGAYLGRDLTADDGAILAVDMASEACRTVAENGFNELQETITLDGTGTDVLVLPRVPVSTVSTVTVGDTVTTEFVQDNGMLFKQSGSWTRGRRNVSVKYKHGYSSSAIPDDVRMVVLALASRLVVQGPAMAEANGDVNVRYAVANTDLTANELRILRRHSGR